MEEIWIIGVGQFGYIAFQRLSAAGQDRHFVLVDPIKENLLRCKGPTVAHEISDGVDFLEKYLKSGRRPEWIIPALPVHLAAEWFLLHLGPERLRRVPLPPDIEMIVPNPIRGSEGNIYVSHADFRCPDDCDEPEDICTITRKKRKQNMYGNRSQVWGGLEIIIAAGLRQAQTGQSRSHKGYCLNQHYWDFFQ